MIDWLLRRQPYLVGYGRSILLGFAAALLAIAQLPRNPFDRIVAVVAVGMLACAFTVWAAVVLITLLRPQKFDDMRRRRSEQQSTREHDR